jgi:hypothetical protein
MARHASGEAQIKAAREQLEKAKTADQIRVAQAVLMPLEMGLSLEQTAHAIGRSVGATCRMRTSFIKVAQRKQKPARSKGQLRNRAKASLAEEAEALDQVLKDHTTGGVLVIPHLCRSPRCTACWHATAGASWLLISSTPKAAKPSERNGKKTPGEAGTDRDLLSRGSTPTGNVPRRSLLWPYQRYTQLLGQETSSSHRQSDGHPSIHLCLWGRIATGRTF